MIEEFRTISTFRSKGQPKVVKVLLDGNSRVNLFDEDEAMKKRDQETDR